MSEDGGQSKGYSGAFAGDRRRAIVLAAMLVGGFLAFALPVILSGNVTGRAGHDQFWFHESVIRKFAAEWPQVNLSDYRSATTPGYHLLLAAVAKFVSADLAVLRLAAAGFTVALYSLFAWGIARAPRQADSSATDAGRPPLPSVLESAALALPALASMYVLFPGAWLQPDNAGWLLVLAILLLCARRTFDGWTVVLGGVLLACAVWMRQVHVWCAGSLLAAAWLGTGQPGAGRIGDLLTGLPARLGRTALMACALFPTAAFLLAFHRLWNGLTPPMFQKQYPTSINWATPAFFFSLLAIVSVFFGAWMLRSWCAVASRHRPLVALAAAVGLAAAAIPETTYLFESRSGGLWGAVQHAPILFGRTSLVLLVLSPIGAAAAATWILALTPRLRWLAFGSGVAFLVAQTATPLAWQRYHEPLILVTLPLLALVPAPCEFELRLARGLSLARLAGPASLAVLLAGITTLTIRSAHPVPDPTDPNGAAAIRSGVTPHHGRGAAP